MQKCNEIKDLLSLYIDDMLDEEEKAKVSSHLEVCANCKTEYEFLNAIIKSTNKIEEKELPSNFKDCLHEKLIMEKKALKIIKDKRKFRKKLVTYTAIAAALTIIVVQTPIINNLFSNYYTTSNTEDAMDTAVGLLEATPKLEKKSSMSVTQSEEPETNENKLMKSKVKEVDDCVNDKVEVLDEGVYDLQVARDERGILSGRSFMADNSLEDKSLARTYSKLTTNKIFIKVKPENLDRIMLELEHNEKLEYVLDYYLNNNILIIDVLRKDYDDFFSFMKNLKVINDINDKMEDITQKYSDDIKEYENLKNLTLKYESNGNLEELDRAKIKLNDIENQINTMKYYSDKTVIEIDAGLAE